MKSNKSQIIVTIVIFTIFISVFLITGNTKTERTLSINNDVITVIIDAGHGGQDPGTVVGEVAEDDINLKIAQTLKDILIKKGFNVVMTRSDNCGLVISEGSEWNKLDDMNIRKEIINSTKAEIMISIHQNYYSDSNVRGAQVFYSACMSENAKLAAYIQEELKYISKTPNNREILQNDEYIVLKNNDKPSVLVECGFLSNDYERAILQTESYRKEIATAIYNGIWKFLTETESTE